MNKTLPTNTDVDIQYIISSSHKD